MSTIAASTDLVAPAERIAVPTHAAAGYRALIAAEQTVELDDTIHELVKIRASQINGCAYCLDMHLQRARAAGETEQRLDTLAGWRDAPFFTARERAALALAEAMTRIADGGVPDAVYDEAASRFDAPELAQLIFAITLINSWNRLAVTARTHPPAR